MTTKGKDIAKKTAATQATSGIGTGNGPVTDPGDGTNPGGPSDTSPKIPPKSTSTKGIKEK